MNGFYIRTIYNRRIAVNIKAMGLYFCNGYILVGFEQEVRISFFLIFTAFNSFFPKK
jgi:hypothetical protein